jgi:hypothetical protein
MLLHIFRLEVKAPPVAPAETALKGKSRGACPRRVEDIIGKGSCRESRAGKDAGYAADGTLAFRSFGGFSRVGPRWRVELGSGVRWTCVRSSRKKKARPLWG